MLYNGKEIAATQMPRGLGNFVAQLRKQYQLYRVCKASSYLTTAQAAEVRALHDFVATLDAPMPPQVWKQVYYEQLVVFHRQHGHLHIPSQSSCKEWQTLRLWMQDICKAYHARQAGERTTLAQRHVEMLQALLSTAADIFQRSAARHPTLILSFQRRDAKDGDDSKSFTTVNRIIAEVKARDWAIECLAWYPVVVGEDTSEVFVFEILPVATP